MAGGGGACAICVHNCPVNAESQRELGTGVRVAQGAMTSEKQIERMFNIMYNIGHRCGDNVLL